MNDKDGTKQKQKHTHTHAARSHKFVWRVCDCAWNLIWSSTRSPCSWPPGWPAQLSGFSDDVFMRGHAISTKKITIRKKRAGCTALSWGSGISLLNSFQFPVELRFLPSIVALFIVRSVHDNKKMSLNKIPSVTIYINKKKQDKTPKMSSSSLASAFHRITRLIQRCATALNKYRT